jgi:hypothetical protein
METGCQQARRGSSCGACPKNDRHSAATLLSALPVRYQQGKRAVLGGIMLSVTLIRPLSSGFRSTCQSQRGDGMEHLYNDSRAGYYGVKETLESSQRHCHFTGCSDEYAQSCLRAPKCPATWDDNAVPVLLGARAYRLLLHLLEAALDFVFVRGPGLCAIRLGRDGMSGALAQSRACLRPWWYWVPNLWSGSHLFARFATWCEPCNTPVTRLEIAI